MQRREFFGLSVAVGVGALSLTGAAQGVTTAELDKRATTKLRLSSQLNGAVPGNSREEKMVNIKKYGCEAVEYGGDVVGQGTEFRKLADDNGLAVSAICWGSHRGDLCQEDRSLIAGLKDDLKKALETAGILGSRGVIYVPAFAHETKLTNQEIRERCLDFLPEMGEFARKHNTYVILEPLCRYEAFFLRQVADATVIAKDCGGPESGVAVMGDFYHMDTEETSDMGAFICGGPYLQHVHLGGGWAEPRRTLPGQNNRRFVDGFRGLKFLGYDGFCSFECGCVGDNKVEFPKSIDFLRREWEEA